MREETAGAVRCRPMVSPAGYARIPDRVAIVTVPFPRTRMDPSRPTSPVDSSSPMTPRPPRWLTTGETHFLTAAAFITMALPLVVFLALQRYFVRGITGGAVKG